MKIRGFMIHFYDKCLHFSHKFLKFALLAAISGCGGPYTHSTSSVTNGLNVMMLENKCYSATPNPELLTKNIQETFYSFENLYPVAFFSIPARIYDYKSPLIINLKRMEKDLARLKKDISRSNLSDSDILRIGEELYYLNHNILRYEAQKCAFPSLARKKNQNIDPFLKMSEFCFQKNQSIECNYESLKKLDKNEVHFVEEQSLKICFAMGNDWLLCQEEIGIERKKRNIGVIALKLYNRFKKEQFNKLFSLKESHLKFSCLKNDEKIEMRINIKFDSKFSMSQKELADYASAIWSRDSFKLHLVLDRDNSSNNNTVVVVPSSSNLSSVPDNDNHTVYLNADLNLMEQKRIFAHEFGHVLGFPDCYTEYYDAQNKDLVYFEMGKDNYNLMCSVKNNVSVPSGYLDQLALNSCNF